MYFEAWMKALPPLLDLPKSSENKRLQRRRRKSAEQREVRLHQMRERVAAELAEQQEAR